MRIIVISDTHIPVMTQKLPPEIKTELKKCDMCLHAGDFIEYSVFKELSSVVETHGVCGNMDSLELKKKMPEKELIEVEDVTIGLAHGRGAPDTVPSFIEELFCDEFDRIDVFVYGHSHQPGVIKRKGKMFFNPGSLSDTIYAPYRSYGVLEINGKTIKPEIVRLD